MVQQSGFSSKFSFLQIGIQKLIFAEGGKTINPEKKPSKRKRESTSKLIIRLVLEQNPGRHGEWRAISLLRQPMLLTPGGFLCGLKNNLTPFLLSFSPGPAVFLPNSYRHCSYKCFLLTSPTWSCISDALRAKKCAILTYKNSLFVIVFQKCRLTSNQFFKRIARILSILYCKCEKVPANLRKRSCGCLV